MDHKEVSDLRSHVKGLGVLENRCTHPFGAAHCKAPIAPHQPEQGAQGRGSPAYDNKNDTAAQDRPRFQKAKRLRAATALLLQTGRGFRRPGVCESHGQKSKGASGQTRNVSTQLGFASRPVPESPVATGWVAWVPALSLRKKQAKVKAGEPHGQERVQHTLGVCDLYPGV